jgi:hypothetical protein
MGTPLKGPDGRIYDVPPEQVDGRIAEGYAPVSAQEQASRVTAAAMDARANERGALGAVNAGLGSFVSGATLGASDVLLGATLGSGQRERYLAEREANPGVSTVANIVGNVAPALLTGGTGTAASIARATPAGALSRLGAKIAESEGAGLGTKLGRAVLGGAVEGAVTGAGDAVSELALSKDPITLERVGSTLSSKMLFGGAVGGAAGGLAKAAEIGLTKAKGVLDSVAEGGVARTNAAVAEDLTGLDDKALRALRDSEKEAIATGHEKALADLEASRVSQREALAKDINSFRREVKGQNQFLTTMGVDLPASGELLGAKELGRKAAKANKALDNLLDDPIGLAQKPEVALKALRVQEDGYVKLLERSDDLKAAYAKEAASKATADETEAALKAMEGRISAGQVPGEAGPFSADGLRAAAERELRREQARAAVGGFEFSPSTGSAVRSANKGGMLAKPAPLGDIAAGPRPAPLAQDEIDAYKDAYIKASNWDHYGAASMYSGSEYATINGALRRGEELTGDVADSVRHLDDALELPESRLPRDTTLYRGLSGDDAKARFANVKPGDVIEDKAFTSTAANADSKVRNEDVVFNIHAPAGTKGAPIPSKYSSEQEILLPRNTKLRVDSNEIVVPDRARFEQPKMDIVEWEVMPDRSVRMTQEYTQIGTGIRRRISETLKPSREINVSIVDEAARTTRHVTAGDVESVAHAMGRTERATANAADGVAGAPVSAGRSAKGGVVGEGLKTGTSEGIKGAAGDGAAAKINSRAAALDQVPAALERNRALQARIAEVTAPHPAKPTTSPRLQAIEDAREALATAAARPKSMPEQMAGGAVYGAAAGIASAIPFIGPAIAPFVGAKAAGYVGEKVFGRLAKAGGEAAARTAKAVSAFVDVTRKASPAVPVLATKVLSRVAFAPDSDATPAPKGTHRETLAPLFLARTAEIRAQVTVGPDGKATMRPEARGRVADRLAPIRAFDPLAADRLETLAARRIEFLADKMPRRPDMAGMPLGKDMWQPSDMAMRQWARYVAAVEDPGGIEERLTGGTVTPEDAEVMREVYPERMADITRQIIEQLPTLRQSLPYHRRIALSVFSGVPVDAAMDPRVLRVLQGAFKSEQGTEGGTKAPQSAPQFGSVKAETATPAQHRAQGAA